MTQARPRRKPPPERVADSIMLACLRRCCVCWGLDGTDVAENQLQIAHLDGDPSNTTWNNLAALCVPHHDELDVVSRQTRRLSPGEVRLHRERLYAVCGQRSADRQADSRGRSGARPLAVRRSGVTEARRSQALGGLLDADAEFVELEQKRRSLPSQDIADGPHLPWEKQRVLISQDLKEAQQARDAAASRAGVPPPPTSDGRTLSDKEWTQYAMIDNSPVTHCRRCRLQMSHTWPQCPRCRATMPDD